MVKQNKRLDFEIEDVANNTSIIFIEYLRLRTSQKS
jgi:hypothetical protein